VLLFFSRLDAPYAAHASRRRSRKPNRRGRRRQTRRVHTKWYLPQTRKPLSPPIIERRVHTTPTRNKLDGRRTRILRMRPPMTLPIPHSTTAARVLLTPLRPSTTPQLSHRPNRRTTRTITTTTRASLLILERTLLHRTITELWTRPNTTRASRFNHLLLPWTIASCAVYTPLPAQLKSPLPQRGPHGVPGIISKSRVTTYKVTPLYSDLSLSIYAPRSGPLVLHQ
jgi:hypothetical protein